ncbi:MAG: helix-turn-helix domain-containing protein [Gammaproteobacteria bacterium]
MDKMSKNEMLEPGTILKNIREKRGVTVEQVAHFLKLPLNVIVSIENNNFSKMPAPMFVRGYLRSYANMLSISSDELVQQYDANLIELESELNDSAVEEKPVKKAKEHYVKKRVMSSNKIKKIDGLIRIIGIVILICVVGLTMLWWRSSEHTIKQKVLSLREKITNKHTALALEKAPEASDKNEEKQ